MQKYRVDKNKSQIVFDITGGDNSMKTMYLATIPKTKQLIRSEGQNFSLRTDDIEGAQPRGPREQKRRDFYFTDDIEGAKPAPAFDRNRNPGNPLALDDIDGAKPRIQRNLPNSNRHTNPLNPVYELPSFKEEPAPVPKFLRDNINYDDIPGVHPKSYKTDKPPRDIMKTDDICKRVISPVKEFYYGNRAMDVSDINNDGVFKTKRHLDPLTPNYFYDGRTLEQDFGLHKSRYLSRRDNIDLSLRTDDIDGAKADSSTTSYRTFKSKPLDYEMYKANTSLQLPSMLKQEKELERQRKIDEMRGEKIRKFENRHLHVDTVNDCIQNDLLQRRQIPPKKKPQVTFQITEQDKKLYGNEE